MRSHAGVTLVETMAVLAIAAILLAIGAIYLTPMAAPLDTGAEIVEFAFRQARGKAIATTSTYRVRPSSAGEIVGEFAPSCARLSRDRHPTGG